MTNELLKLVANSPAGVTAVGSGVLLGHDPESWTRILSAKISTGEDAKKAAEQIIRAAMNQAATQMAEAIRAKLKHDSKGEPDTWGFAYMFNAMIDKSLAEWPNEKS